MQLKNMLKGWRTVIVGVLIGVPLVLLQILEALQVVDVSTVLPPPWGQRIALITSILMIILRFYTNTPVGVEEPIKSVTLLMPASTDVSDSPNVSDSTDLSASTGLSVSPDLSDSADLSIKTVKQKVGP